MFDKIRRIIQSKDMIVMSDLKAEEYKSFEQIKKQKIMEQNIGVLEN